MEAWRKGLYLAHHGILGQKWGIRRYQNPDGSLTEAGRRRLEKKDAKWANKNYKKIQGTAYKESKKELRDYVRNELNPKYAKLPKGKNYINEYNRRMAEIMNTKVADLTSPSGRTVKFIAKRGQVGVHLALADAGYDMSQVKNGVWASGRIAYKKKTLDVSSV